MPTDKRLDLTRNEIARVFEGDFAAKLPPIISPERLAQFLGRSRTTIYFWISVGRLDGCFRKRGKHILILRDRALEKIFNGEKWSKNE